MDAEYIENKPGIRKKASNDDTDSEFLFYLRARTEINVERLMVFDLMSSNEIISRLA